MDMPLDSSLRTSTPERQLEWIGDPTLADAILDRLVHNAYKVTLTGPSIIPASLPGRSTGTWAGRIGGTGQRPMPV